MDPFGTTAGRGTFVFQTFCFTQGPTWTSHIVLNSYSLIYNIFSKFASAISRFCFHGGLLTQAKCQTADNPAGKQEAFLYSSIPREPWLMVHRGLQTCFSISFGLFVCLHVFFYKTNCFYYLLSFIFY